MTEQRRARLVGWEALAEYLDISDRHAKRLQQEKRIPFIRVGGLIRFDLNAIDQWILENTVPAEPEEEYVSSYHRRKATPARKPATKKAGDENRVLQALHMWPGEPDGWEATANIARQAGVPTFEASIILKALVDRGLAERGGMRGRSRLYRITQPGRETLGVRGAAS